MGRALVRAVCESTDMHLAFALEQEGHLNLGHDAGALAGINDADVVLTDDPLSAMANSDVVLDFTVPAASVALCDLSAQARVVHVIGTTGFSYLLGNLFKLAF